VPEAARGGVGRQLDGLVRRGRDGVLLVLVERARQPRLLVRVKVRVRVRVRVRV
jgi:hypothetical protein|tara:strand:+ start:774 stop:935 length:162 start_codon:yes stop_codon:yes gene_type:complete